jgi:hypothetical protein
LDVLLEIGVDAVSAHDVTGVVVREPRRAAGVFVDQRFQRQIEPDRRRRREQRRAAFRVAEDDELLRAKRKAGNLRVAREVDSCENAHALPLEERDEPVDRLRDTVRRSHPHDPVRCLRWDCHDRSPESATA